MVDVARGELPVAVRNSLANPEFDWRTADGVARDAGLEVERAVQLLESSREVVRASQPNPKGKALYRLRDRQPLFSRLLSVIANDPA